jgi:LacI family transcriptional regulator
MDGSDNDVTRAGIRDVAARAGVSVSSVSRVISGHRDVSQKMSERVLLAAADLRYEPDELAQGLRTGSSHTIGFVVSDISNPVLAPIVLGAEVFLRRHGLTLFITNSELLADRDVEHIRMLRRRRVDGLLLSLSDERSVATAEAVRAAELPVVLIDRELLGAPGCSSVLIDHGAGVRAAARHLATLGHQRIGLVIGPTMIRPNRERLRALRTVARRNGLQVLVADGNSTEAEARAAAATLLDAAEPPTALIAGGNQMLAGVLRSARDHHRQIPRDLSLVTCDDVPLLEFVEPPLATVTRNLREVGETAASLLIERLAGAPPRSVMTSAGFDPRDSCRPPWRP